MLLSPQTLYALTYTEVVPLCCKTKTSEGRPTLGKSSLGTYRGCRSWQGTLVSVCCTSYHSVDARKEGKLGFFQVCLLVCFFLCLVSYLPALDMYEE